MPRSFSFPLRGLRFNGAPAEVFFPVSWSTQDREEMLNNFDYSMIARLRPNATVPQAGAEAALLLKRIAATYPPDLRQLIRQRMPNFSLISQVAAFREDVTGDVRRPLLLLLASVGILLLMGCADVANLMFSRMLGR
ncbi:MAG: hypothetical protein WB992_26240 [Bryobacteraceae bacterium]